MPKQHLSEADETDGSEARLCDLIARRTTTNPSEWTLVFKARYAMLAAFSSLCSAEGTGLVLTQLLSCATAVDPILVGGLKPHYAEISPETLALDVNKMRLDEHVRAVVLQHTFGIIDEKSSYELVARVHEAHSLVVEDCAHCVGRFVRDHSGRPVADIIIFSFGVEKMLPTHFGGAIWVNPELAGGRHKAFYELLKKSLATLPPLNSRLEKASRNYLTNTRILNHLPAAFSDKLRKRWIADGILEPAVSDEERRGRIAGVAQRPSSWINLQAIEALENLANNEASRIAVVAKLSGVLGAQEVVHVPTSILAGEPQPLMRYPVLVKDRDVSERLVSFFRSNNVYAEHWGRPLLFPGVLDEEPYHLPEPGELAVTRDVSNRILCLPTEVTQSQLDFMLSTCRGSLSL